MGKGRQAFAPTGSQKRLVRQLLKDNRKQEEIANTLGISTPTLRKHFKDEIAAAKANVSQGRPEHVPSEESREDVERMIACGDKKPVIAAALGISVPTLNKHYQAELMQGPARQRRKNVRALFAAAEAGNVAAMKHLDQIMDRAAAGQSFVEPPPKLGKKEQADIDAATAGEGSEWGDDLISPAAPMGLPH